MYTILFNWLIWVCFDPCSFLDFQPKSDALNGCWGNASRHVTNPANRRIERISRANNGCLLAAKRKDTLCRDVVGIIRKWRHGLTVLEDGDHLEQFWGGKHLFASYLEPALRGHPNPKWHNFATGNQWFQEICRWSICWSGPSVCNSGRRTNFARDGSHPVRRGRGAADFWGHLLLDLLKIIFVFPLVNPPLLDLISFFGTPA